MTEGWPTDGSKSTLPYPDFSDSPGLAQIHDALQSRTPPLPLLPPPLISLCPPATIPPAPPSLPLLPAPTLHSRVQSQLRLAAACKALREVLLSWVTCLVVVFWSLTRAIANWKQAQGRGHAFVEREPIGTCIPPAAWWAEDGRALAAPPRLHPVLPLGLQSIEWTGKDLKPQNQQLNQLRPGRRSQN
ncbi:uncharacterized protein LOC131200143 isoform X2 [Ahaetulla prasina]|uniref:uncharacterized protein LOC131200143 isoform X2 n=1 Tax=Ahaetulla prasina TaxID=499056 RepID=UPI0026473B7D|nr:uncharacterized protein LOC131200143 isoform X2 [Ahaetulla prasina]